MESESIMVCRQCSHYKLDTEKVCPDSKCKIAFCQVSYNNMRSVIGALPHDGFVDGGDTTCDDFNDRGDSVHSRRTGRPIAKGWPQGYSREEAIIAKTIIMNKSNTVHNISEKLGIPASSIRMIRYGKMWPAVPTESEILSNNRV